MKTFTVEDALKEAINAESMAFGYHWGRARHSSIVLANEVLRLREQSMATKPVDDSRAFSAFIERNPHASSLDTWAGGESGNEVHFYHKETEVDWMVFKSDFEG